MANRHGEHRVVDRLVTNFHLPRSTLLMLVAAFAGYEHAMALYRGKPWINALIVINNLARFGSGEQDQAVGGFAYYVRTLGVAALPWSAVMKRAPPLSFTASAMRPMPASTVSTAVMAAPSTPV